MMLATTRAARRVSFLAAVIPPLVAAVVPGDRVSAQAPNRFSTKEEERKKFDEMRQVVRRFQVTSIDESGRQTPATPVAEPLHRWTDPTRPFSGGALWAWRSSGRPVAIIAIELYDSWSLEFVSLSTGPMQADDGAIRWAPSRGGVAFQAFTEAPAPAADEAGRLRQMRDLARGFTASEFYKDRHHALRLLSHPIDRYADPTSGLVDGAIFAYANGTNPEILLMLEARRQGDGPLRWVYAAAPLSKAELTLKRGPRDVWTSPSKDVRTLRPDETYYIKLTPRIRSGV